MAQSRNAELIIVSVVPSLPLTSEEGFSPLSYSNLEQELEQYTENNLNETKAEITKKYKVKVSTILKHGSAARKIIEVARETGADLIVVGNRGTSGLLSWMLGSTSRSVVEACTVPVLVVKDSKYCQK
jgi:nucleotide-binding universal stress UspA family protein